MMKKTRPKSIKSFLKNLDCKTPSPGKYKENYLVIQKPTKIKRRFNGNFKENNQGKTKKSNL